MSAGGAVLTSGRAGAGPSHAGTKAQTCHWAGSRGRALLAAPGMLIPG